MRSKQDTSGKGKPFKKGSGNTFKKGNTGNSTSKKVEGEKKNTKPSGANKMEGIRLNKYIANSGICSRREADMYIATGQVTVNGKVVNEMGFKVAPGDVVRFDDRPVNPEPNTYVLLNKPKGFSTTNSDAKGNTVMDLVANATSSKIKPYGRLGRNSTGLLLFTNDEEFRQKFTKKGITRLFHIELDKNLKAEDLQKIREGLKISDKKILVDDVSYVKDAPKKEIGLKIKHTGNSIIRTIFDYLGYDVVKVDCVTLGPLTKKDLPRGRWRLLTQQELDMFSMI